MKNKYKIFMYIYFAIVSIIVLTTDKLHTVVTTLEYVGCGTAEGIPKPIPQLTTVAYTLLIVGTPLVLIVFSIVDLIKAITGGNTEAIMKSRNKLIKKFVAAALIFVISAIVQFVIGRVTSNSNDKNSVAECLQCFLYYNDSTCHHSTTGNNVTEGSYRPSYENQSQPTEDKPSSDGNSGSSTPNVVNSSQTEAIRKMFYAVETGGQVYGQARYDDLTEAYAATSNETAITIGAGGWFANEGRDLLRKIKAKDPEMFKKFDNAGIANDIEGDWTYYRITEDSAKGKAIKSIIGSDSGKKAQDEMMDEQINKYLQTAKDAGITDLGGQVMYAEIMHCGGKGAADRILGHATKPYNAESLYKAVTTSWPEDANLNAPINGSLYRSRHDKVYGWIKQYLK